MMESRLEYTTCCPVCLKETTNRMKLTVNGKTTYGACCSEEHMNETAENVRQKVDPQFHNKMKFKFVKGKAA
jgi:hypothetical protein